MKSLIGHDGFRFGFKPTLKKVVNDRRASLDDGEVKKATQALVRTEFSRGAALPLVLFPEDGTAVQDTPRLTLVVLDPEVARDDKGPLKTTLADWTKQRGKSPRLYPGSLVWWVRKPGRELKDKVETSLAWKRVEKEVADGTLEGEFERGDRTEITTKVREAEDAAKDEVWANYRYIVLADNQEPDGLKVIDLGAGHMSALETLSGRVVGALKSQALLNESPGASYLDRRWPQAFKESGAWPILSLRQAFLNGSMERLLDSDVYLRNKIPEFVSRGDFGLASGKQPDGGYSRIWFEEMLPVDEVTFDADVYLLTKARAKALKSGTEARVTLATPTEVGGVSPTQLGGLFPETETGIALTTGLGKRTLRLVGNIPPEVWNRLGTKLLPKLRAGSNLQLGLQFAVELDADQVTNFQAELRQVLGDLNLAQQVRIEID